MMNRPTQQRTPDETFAEYFIKNYPGPNTVIGRPEWHAPKIFRAAKYALDHDALVARVASLEDTLAEIDAQARNAEELGGTGPGFFSDIRDACRAALARGRQ